MDSDNTINEDSDPDEYIQTQYLQIIDRFKSDWNELHLKIKKPRVLIAGITGSGKSSIINTIFGVTIANVGVGYPVTQYFQQFEPANKPIIIYDSKGLECGMHEDFISTTREFLDSHIANIDIIWYVINSASTRIQPFEHTLLTDIFKDIPMIVILNKADITQAEDIQILKNVILEFNLPNLLGIYETIGDHLRYRIEVCPNCKSDQIVLAMKTKIIKCEACHVETNLYATHDGLNNVIEKTIEYLPEFVKESFICSQLINLKSKEEHSINLIREWYLKSIKTEKFKELISSLSHIWNFSNNFKKSTASMNMRLKILCKDVSNKTRAAAIAILWMHCLRKLATIVLDNFLKCINCDTVNMDLINLSNSSFNEFNNENVNIVITLINTSGIEIALKNEYNDFIKDEIHIHESHKCVMSDLSSKDSDTDSDTDSDDNWMLKSNSNSCNNLTNL